MDDVELCATATTEETPDFNWDIFEKTINQLYSETAEEKPILDILLMGNCRLFWDKMQLPFIFKLKKEDNAVFAGIPVQQHNDDSFNFCWVICLTKKFNFNNQFRVGIDNDIKVFIVRSEK